MDFGGFGEASWEGKSSQERSKSDPKMHRKNDGKKHALGAENGRPRAGGPRTYHGEARILGPPN